jgi:uncharacterized membrane protein YfcA
MDPWLILFGFGVGILVGTTGIVGAPLVLGLLAFVVLRDRLPRTTLIARTEP